MIIKCNIINRSKHPLPEYATSHSAGMDLRANIDDKIVLSSLERAIVPTGLFIELPEGYEAQVRPRSGLAAKFGIIVVNSPGTIDSDYRGEIKIILGNISREDFIINDGDRIAQLVISKYEKVEWNLSSELSDSNRSGGGFGHTGIK